MRTRNRLLAVLLIGVVLISMGWDHLPMDVGESVMERIPQDGWEMRSREVPLSDLEKKWLAGAEGVKRLYEIDGHYWLLAVTDGSRNRQVVHDPEYCFRGAGWKIEGRERLPLGRGWAEKLALSRDAERMDVLYWFSDGGPPFVSMIEYWGWTTLRRLTRGASGSEPLLFLLRPVNSSMSAAGDPISVAPILLP